MLPLVEFHRDRFATTPALFSYDEIHHLIATLELQSASSEQRTLRGGQRDVLDTVPALRNLSAHASIRALAERIL